MSKQYTPILILLVAAIAVYFNKPPKLELIEVHTKCRTFDTIVIYYPSTQGKCLPDALSWYIRSR
jgi:hypothetical protein